MMFRTHLLFNLFVALLLIKYLDPVMPWLFLVAFVVAGTLPDIDTTKSRIGKRYRKTSMVANFLFGHRGLLHTIYPAMTLFAIFYMLELSLIAFAFLLGYVNHLVLDMFTREGIHVFYPLSKFHVRGFFKTGGFFEVVLQAAFIISIIYAVRSFIG
jgi:inner membrane protein